MLKIEAKSKNIISILALIFCIKVLSIKEPKIAPKGKADVKIDI